MVSISIYLTTPISSLLTSTIILLASTRALISIIDGESIEYFNIASISMYLFIFYLLDSLTGGRTTCSYVIIKYITSTFMFTRLYGGGESIYIIVYLLLFISSDGVFWS